MTIGAEKEQPRSARQQGHGSVTLVVGVAADSSSLIQIPGYPAQAPARPGLSDMRCGVSRQPLPHARALCRRDGMLMPSATLGVQPPASLRTRNGSGSLRTHRVLGTPSDEHAAPMSRGTGSTLGDTT